MEHKSKGPASFGEAARSMMSPGAPRLTPDEEAEVEATADEEMLGDTPVDSPLAAAAERAGQEGEHGASIVARVPIPGGLVIPPWRQIGYFIFKPDLTERPDLGERTCVTWGLTVAEERLAKQAMRGDGTRSYEEMTKRMIRCMDGVKADWSGKGGKGNVNHFWEEIGPKARTFLINGYLQTHTPSPQETADFFLNCTTYRTSVGGR